MYSVLYPVVGKMLTGQKQKLGWGWGNTMDTGKTGSAGRIQVRFINNQAPRLDEREAPCSEGTQLGDWESSDSSHGVITGYKVFID